ncbi:Uncharacterised protein [Alistipes sp. cv1]|nr:Uncharacterised protein [Faecalibacterium prausnitzii]
MTRQEAVIKISKITRIIGELKYQLDADDEIEFEALDPDWLHIAEWTQEICRYMTQDASPQVARLIANIGFTEIVEKYVQSHRQEIEAPHAKILDDYVEGIRNLSLLCDTRSDKQKKKYADLIEPLANEQVAALLKRAVGAGLLDEHYQPTPQTKSLQLKVIAYAVSFLCQLPSVYVLFEKQWHRENGKRISNSRIPRYDASSYEEAKALYPEVDFSKFEPIHEIETFYVPQSEEELGIMYEDLVKYEYIAPDTTFDVFKGIFDKTKFSKPVEWAKTQRQLAYFIDLAFSKFNRRHLWIKSQHCFRINGHIPHKESIVTGYSTLKRAGWMDRYDIRLKAICDRFNHIENVAPQAGLNDIQSVHVGKLIFRSTRSDKEKFGMYQSLIDGEYIDANTTFSIFNGIFDELAFKQPIMWMKKQSQLMYFVHLAFQTDNPLDVWAKCTYCFRLPNGKEPNRRAMASRFYSVVKNGLLDTYDTELKRIAEEYNGMEK